MNLDQCPYIVNSSEPDHTYNCRLTIGHSGPHEDYTGGREGLWYVKELVRCPNCCGLFSQDRITYVADGRPDADQRKKR